MRLSSSSLVIASAKTSCSVRSAKRFTGSPFRWVAGISYIRSILKWEPGILSPVNGTLARKTDAREMIHEPESYAPNARAGHPADYALLLAVLACGDAGRPCDGHRRKRPNFSGQAFLCRRLAPAGRRCRDGRVAS